MVVQTDFKFVVDFGVVKLVIESDCLIVINALRAYKKWYEYRLALDDFFKLSFLIFITFVLDIICCATGGDIDEQDMYT